MVIAILLDNGFIQPTVAIMIKNTPGAAEKVRIKQCRIIAAQNEEFARAEHAIKNIQKPGLCGALILLVGVHLVKLIKQNHARYVHRV